MTDHVTPEEARVDGAELREWIKDFRDGQFSPAYYTKRWPVEMDGLVDDTEALLNERDSLAAQVEEAEQMRSALEQIATFPERPTASSAMAQIARLALREASRSEP